MPDSEHPASPDEPSGIDHLDDFDEFDAVEGSDSPRRLPSWVVNPPVLVNRMPHACRLLANFLLTEPDLQLGYDDQFREYYIRFAEPDSSVVMIYHCPFCGTELPPSLRDQWFERVFELELDPDDPRVPQSMRSGQWWREAAL